MKPKVNFGWIIAMLIVFLLTDLGLFLALGVMLLNGREFTGLNQETPVYFHAGDYFVNCTIWCIAEDLLLALVYVISVKRSKEIASRKLDPTYFWLIHTIAKIFINLHCTGMFLSIIEYSRESQWREYGSARFADDLEAAFSTFSLPANCFREQRSSLLLCLSVLLFTFCILMNYPRLVEKPLRLLWLAAADAALFPMYNPRVSNGLRIIILLFVAAVAAACEIIPRMMRQKPAALHRRESAGPIDLHKRYVRLFTILFLVFTALWWAVGTFNFAKDNINSLWGIQYSAIMKMLTPLLMLSGCLLERTEKSDPERYVQHSANLYRWNVVTLILIACIALMLFGEFGSVVCIMLLTALMFLLFADFSDPGQGRVLLRIITSLVYGVLLGVLAAAAENAALQALLWKYGEHLNGMLGSLHLDSMGLLIFGVVSAFLLLYLFLVNVLELFFPNRKNRFLLKKLLIHLLNSIEKLFGMLTIHLPFLMKKKREEKKQNSTRKPLHHMMSISLLIPAAGAVLLYFNFFLNAYTGTTVLKSFYMKAGNFSNEFEITENITQKRCEQVALALKQKYSPETEEELIPAEVDAELRRVAALRHPDRVIQNIENETERIYTFEEMEELLSFNPNVYKRGSLALRVIRIIDRLCFSTHTAELSQVQEGLRSNMGFQSSKTMQNTTYIKTLQSKSYLYRSDVLSASHEVIAAYYNEDGTLKPEFCYMKANGEEYDGEGDPQIWHYGTMLKRYRIIYDNNFISVETVPAKEWQVIFKSAKPMTASSDYVLYTLSRMGVGNCLLFIFIPYFFTIVLLLAFGMDTSDPEPTARGRVRYLLHNLGLLYAVSFMVQTIVIVWGVFGVFLFSGLSLPMIASGNFEMFMNSICTALILISVADPYPSASGSQEPRRNEHAQ